MNKQLLERYATLKIEGKRIDNELEFLQKEALMEIQTISPMGDPVEVSGLGTFTVNKKKKWQFSEDLMDKKVKVSEQEAQEKADGTAKFEEQDILIFKEKA